MKKIIWGLILITVLYSCAKEQIQQVQKIVFSNEYTLFKDTTINGIWDGQGKILRSNNFRVKGSGTLVNWIIDAPLTANVFDTSIQLSNITPYGEYFSIMWWGASPEQEDNWKSIQQSINLSINNFSLWIPKGNFKYSQSLTAAVIYKGEYVGCCLKMYGQGDIWDGSSILTFTGTDGFGLGMQWNKGSIIKGITFVGQFVAPRDSYTPEYYKLTQDQYNDVSGRCGKYYSGIVIDYDGSKNTGGSTGIELDGVWVTGFDVLYDVSPNGVTYNADILRFTSIRCGNGRIGVRSGEAQEKGNVIGYIASWENLHTLISIGQSGKIQGSNWLVNGGNIAGGCIRLFNVWESGWNSFHVTGLHAESIATLGYLGSGDTYYVPSISIDKCQFFFSLPNEAGYQTLLRSNWTGLDIARTDFWYYGLPGEPLNFEGTANIESSCNFSGPQVWHPL